MAYLELMAWGPAAGDRATANTIEHYVAGFSTLVFADTAVSAAQATTPVPLRRTMRKKLLTAERNQLYFCPHPLESGFYTLQFSFD